MKKTTDGRGYLIYKCRNCGEKFYSDLIEEHVDGIFLNAPDMYNMYHSHDCNDVQTGLGDIIGYTEAGAGIKKRSSLYEKVSPELKKSADDFIESLNTKKKFKDPTV